MGPLSSLASRKRPFVRLVLGLGLLGLLSFLLLRQIDWTQLLVTLKGADPRLLALAVGIDLTLNVTAFVQRLRVLLHAFPSTRRERCLEIVGLSMACYAAGVLVPGQPGLAIRTVEMHRRYGYQYRDLITAQLVEKVIEVLSLSVLGALALLGMPPKALAVPLWILVLGAPIGATVLGLGASFLSRRCAGGQTRSPAWRPLERLLAAVLRIGESLQRLHAPERLLGALAWSVVSHLCGALALGLCLMAMGLPLPVSHWFLVYLVVNLALIFPLTPGQLGIVEAGVVAVLILQGVPREQGLAFALVYHAVQIIPTSLLGVTMLPFMWPLSGGNTPTNPTLKVGSS